jgi:hypothetical protein
VTDSEGARPDWLPLLEDIIRGSVHGTRNALNGAVVNLEVVRSRLARGESDDAVLPFAEQAVAQVESAVRLNEGVRALLALVTASVDATGRLRCSVKPDTSTEIRFNVGPGAAERAMPGLTTLGEAAGFSAESHDGTVILSFRRSSSSELRNHE